MKIEAAAGYVKNAKGVIEQEFLLRVTRSELNALGGGHCQIGDFFGPFYLLENLRNVSASVNCFIKSVEQGCVLEPMKMDDRVKTPKKPAK